MIDKQFTRGHLPLGVQDLLQGEAALRRAAETTLRELFSNWSYREVIPPTFEYDDTLSVGAGPELRRTMYRFLDRDGNTLALRADFTTQVARIAASKLSDMPLPLRSFYLGSLFRCEEPQVGRQREFTQAGVELIGANTPFADAEVVALAAAALDALSIPGYQINLSHMGIFRSLATDFSVEHLTLVREATDSRNRARLLSALDEAGASGRRHALLAKLPDLIGGPEVLEQALALGGTVAEAADALGKVYALLDNYGVADRVILDLGEVRGMDYYTGITFRGVAPGSGWPIVSGGRYDELIAQFGRSLPAVGFGMGLERALLAQQPPDAAERPRVIVQHTPDGQCLAVAQELRQAGCPVELDVLGRTTQELLNYARQVGGGWVVRCHADGTLGLLTDLAGERSVTVGAIQEALASWND